jgi:hypothetical protein
MTVDDKKSREKNQYLGKISCSGIKEKEKDDEIVYHHKRISSIKTKDIFSQDFYQAGSDNDKVCYKEVPEDRGKFLEDVEKNDNRQYRV